MAGFADQTFDARSACVAGLDADLLSGQSFKELVTGFRGLGAPVLFACCRGELQWWSFTTQGAEFRDKISYSQLSNFFSEHREKFSPKSIYRAKNLGRLDPHLQLEFVDVGLMPLFEHEMGRQLSRLIRRMCDALLTELGKPKVDENLGRWLFRSVFRLLAAKILNDKQVSEFSDLNLDDVCGTLRKVHNHYSSELQLETVTQRQETGLKAAAEMLKKFGSLRNLTIESLAYVYENALITKDIRKALGIHATPSYLVDYIVWQLAPAIEDIPKNKRVVLEPTCGHAPFLISAARFLRDMIDESDPKKRHNYLKDHLLGIEIDPFAREIARLSLTLADVPNPNGWKLIGADVYKGQVLLDTAKEATILLCNPPFQDFTPREQSEYKRHGVHRRYLNKAAEVIARTLPYMSQGSVFGIILPRGFMHRKDISQLRRYLAYEFDLGEICELPDNLFASAKHESVVLLGRKCSKIHRTVVQKNNTKIIRVKRWNLEKFWNRYNAPCEVVSQARLQHEPSYDFLVPELESVWRYLESFPNFEDVAIVGKGLEYKGKDKLQHNVKTISKSRFPGSIRGYTNFDDKIKLTERPKFMWMSLNSKVIRRSGLGKDTGISQVLLNYAPVSQEPWRLKALIDYHGRPVTSRFIVIRPKKQQWSLEVIWAILNSPLANAYIYTRSTKRDVLVKQVKQIPVPEFAPDSLARLSNLVRGYFKLVSSSNEALRSAIDKKEAKKYMLTIDAEVMRLYDLPPKLERRVLYMFDGWERKGVDFEFTRYFPKDFESFIPLHEYLSEEYQRSNVSFVSKWVEEVKSPEIAKVFEAASEAFRED